MCRQAPQEILDLEHLGVTFHRNEEGKLGTRAFGGASAARTYYVADITGQAILHVLYEQLMKHDEVYRYEEWFTTALVRDDEGPHRRLRRAQHPRRRDGAVRRQDRDPRERRQRAGLQPDDERPHLHRRRNRDGLPDRLPADGHGDDPVPPDDAPGERPPDHRGRPRRGRAPLQRPGRALHGEVRAEQDGARLARRGLARRADRDQRGPRLPGRHRRPRHHRRAAQAHPRGAARDRDGRPRLRRRRHHQGADPHQAGQPLRHGRRQDRLRRAHARAWPVRGRRGGLRVGARRQPAGRQLAARHAGLRRPLGPARGPARQGASDAGAVAARRSTTRRR